MALAVFARTGSDYEDLKSVVSSPDSVESGGPTWDGLQTIIYKKVLGDVVVYVQEVRTGRKKLAAKSLWKIRLAPPATA